MKYIFLQVIFLISVAAIAQGDPADLLRKLDRKLDRADYYVAEKEQRIGTMRLQLQQPSISLAERITLLESIAGEYQSFHFDSAFHYTRKMNGLAYQAGVPLEVTRSRIMMSFMFISSGMFKEAKDTLFSVRAEDKSRGIQVDYYTTVALYYYGMADLQDVYFHEIYQEKGMQYVDSVLLVTAPDSYTHLYFRGLQNVRSGNYQAGLPDLERLQDMEGLSLHQQAIVHSTMSDIFINLGDEEKAIELLAKASVFDIRSATKETAAILNLANILYRNDDIQRAYRYTRHALENANFYGARHRKIQVGSILPIIEEEKISLVERQKRLLMLYSIVATLLVLVIVISIVIIQRQLQRIKGADHKLQEAYDAISQTNAKLIEANKIKEEYLGYYFNVVSNYIEKIEHLKESLEKSLDNNKFDTARYIARTIDPRKERTNLFQGFDRVFLSIFPGFVEEFNNLFREEDRIRPGDNELMNTDLRIFALIRLGISENDKIARILDLSVNTIYTYKTKTRNKAIVPNEEFEQRIMEIRLY